MNGWTSELAAGKSAWLVAATIRRMGLSPLTRHYKGLVADTDRNLLFPVLRF